MQVESYRHPGGDGKIIFHVVMSTTIKIHICYVLCIALSIIFHYLHFFQSCVYKVLSYLWSRVFKEH